MQDIDDNIVMCKYTCAAALVSPGSNLLLQWVWGSLLAKKASCFHGHLSLPTLQTEVAQSAVGVIDTAIMFTRTVILCLCPWWRKWRGGREESHRQCLSSLNITNRNIGQPILCALALRCGPWTSGACPWGHHLPMRQLLTWSDFIHQVPSAAVPACSSSLLPLCWGDVLHNSLQRFLSAPSLSAGDVSSHTTQLWFNACLQAQTEVSCWFLLLQGVFPLIIRNSVVFWTRDSHRAVWCSLNDPWSGRVKRVVAQRSLHLLSVYQNNQIKLLTATSPPAFYVLLVTEVKRS